MKIRTVYFFAPDMTKSTAFWQAILGFEPHKKSEFWTEFKCENINLGLLGENNEATKSNFVPVFEVGDNELEPLKEKCLSAGATIHVDISKHPDGKSYVMKDPFGNEFEITRFRD